MVGKCMKNFLKTEVFIAMVLATVSIKGIHLDAAVGPYYKGQGRFQTNDRVLELTKNLFLNGTGLEIAPFYRPTLLSTEYDVFYTDYTTASELIKKHHHLPNVQEIDEETVEVDFIWYPETQLINCIPRELRFDYVIASHVIEHVPNVIAWTSQILNVLKTGGVLSLAVPDKQYTFDFYRAETQVSELIDIWIRDEKIPTPLQIYDMLSLSVFDYPRSEGGLLPFSECGRPYTDQEALDFALHAFTTNTYLDIHCSVFTPESFIKVFEKLHELGLLNVSLSEPVIGASEFFVQITKLGEPKLKHHKG